MSKNDDPRCDHPASSHAHRVSSLRDGEEWRNRSLRSVWVCGDRSCTLDAQAWCLRSGEPEVFTYARRGHECSMCIPVEVSA